MKAKSVLVAMAALATVVRGVSAAEAQVPPSMRTPVLQAAPKIAPQKLDATLAPISLYPDPLVAQILVAATYPLEVVEADRWMQKPANAALKGRRMMSVLDQQTWDPSVKSLVPFPQILYTMDSNLKWTERLGNALLADQAAVLDSVQRLRERAEAASELVSPPQHSVSTYDGVVMIEAANPDIVCGYSHRIRTRQSALPVAHATTSSMGN